MSSPIDTADWGLSAYIDWRPLRKPEYVTCPCCHGTGEVGGGFKSLDGPRPCPECFGSKMQQLPFVPLAEKPVVPRLLVEHMHKAWIAYFQQFEAKEPTNG